MIAVKTFSSRAPNFMDRIEQQIKTSVVACIIDSQDRVLLTRRCIEPFCDQWVLPGGKIDHGEPLLEALHREVREEVGLEIQIDGLLDVYEHVGLGQNKDHYVILYYRARPLSAELVANTAEVSAAAWVESTDLDRYDIAPGARHILAQIFPGQAGTPEAD